MKDENDRETVQPGVEGAQEHPDTRSRVEQHADWVANVEGVRDRIQTWLDNSNQSIAEQAAHLQDVSGQVAADASAALTSSSPEGVGRMNAGVISAAMELERRCVRRRSLLELKELLDGALV